jgi:peptide/nickel transport system permease protein
MPGNVESRDRPGRRHPEGRWFLRFVLRRLATSLVMALGVATLVFAALEIAPGEPEDLLVGSHPVPPEVRDRIVRVWGLDLAPHERYLRWLGALARGDLGWSVSQGRSTASALADALPATLSLAGGALLIYLTLGVTLGVASAVWRRRWPDRVLSLASLAVYAMPTFWLGLMALQVFSSWLGLLPASHLESVGADGLSPVARLVDRLWHLVLPASVLGLSAAASLARFVRSGVLEAMGREFIRAARARGADRTRVIRLHALRNALLPVITMVGLSLPALLSGSIAVEFVFAWPGMGRLTWDAISQLDTSLVLAATMLATVLVVLGSLAADIAMAAADPRIRLDRTGSAR